MASEEGENFWRQCGHSFHEGGAMDIRNACAKSARFVILASQVQCWLITDLRFFATSYSTIQDPPRGQPTHTHTRNRPEGTETDNPTGPGLTPTQARTYTRSTVRYTQDTNVNVTPTDELYPR